MVLFGLYIICNRNLYCCAVAHFVVVCVLHGHHMEPTGMYPIRNTSAVCRASVYLRTACVNIERVFRARGTLRYSVAQKNCDNEIKKFCFEHVCAAIRFYWNSNIINVSLLYSVIVQKQISNLKKTRHIFILHTSSIRKNNIQSCTYIFAKMTHSAYLS